MYVAAPKLRDLWFRNERAEQLFKIHILKSNPDMNCSFIVLNNSYSYPHKHEKNVSPLRMLVASEWKSVIPLVASAPGFWLESAGTPSAQSTVRGMGRQKDPARVVFMLMRMRAGGLLWAQVDRCERAINHSSGFSWQSFRGQWVARSACWTHSGPGSAFPMPGSLWHSTDCDVQGSHLHGVINLNLYII